MQIYPCEALDRPEMITEDEWASIMANTSDGIDFVPKREHLCFAVCAAEPRQWPAALQRQGCDPRRSSPGLGD